MTGYKCFIVLPFLLLWQELFAQTHKQSDTVTNKCYYLKDICFRYKPKRIYNYLHESNKQGLLVKVYKYKLSNSNLDTLNKLGFKNLPLPMREKNLFLLKRHFLNDTDNGYYKLIAKEEYGATYLIFNATKNLFIIYEYGILDDL